MFNDFKRLSPFLMNRKDRSLKYGTKLEYYRTHRKEFIKCDVISVVEKKTYVRRTQADKLRCVM